MTSSPSREREPGRWSRYVAVGDSFTEGMSDADPRVPDRFVGWADRLAAHLAAVVAGEDFGYANLAVRGRLLADIAGRQVDDALALGPDLVSIVGGGNDILRPKADIDALAGRAGGRRRADPGHRRRRAAWPRRSTRRRPRWCATPVAGPPSTPPTSGPSPAATTPSSSTSGA